MIISHYNVMPNVDYIDNLIEEKSMYFIPLFAEFKKNGYYNYSPTVPVSIHTAHTIFDGISSP